MYMSRTTRTIALAAATVLASITMMTNVSAATSIIAGKFDYFWIVDRNIAGGILADSPTFQFDNLQAEYTYDVSTVAAHDIVSFAITAQKNATGSSVSLQHPMLTRASINGVPLSPMEFMGASEFRYTKVAGDTTVKMNIISQSPDFDSANAKAGRFGAVKIVPTITVEHMVAVANSDPVEYTLDTTDAPIAVTPSTAGVTGLRTVFGMRHNGKSVTLPKNVVSSFSDVEWHATSTVAKNTIVKSTKLTGTAKSPHARSATELAPTWCTARNNYCRTLASNKDRAFFSLSASNPRVDTAYAESTNQSTLKLPWATKRVYVSQGITVNSVRAAGTVLTVSAIAITK